MLRTTAFPVEGACRLARGEESQVDDVRTDLLQICVLDEEDAGGSHTHLVERDPTIGFRAEHGIAAKQTRTNGDSVSALVVDGILTHLLGGLGHHRGPPVGVRDIGAGHLDLLVEHRVVALGVATAESEEEHEDREGDENTHGSDPGAG